MENPEEQKQPIEPGNSSSKRTNARNQAAARPNAKEARVIEVIDNGRIMDTPSLHELLRDDFPKLNTLQVTLNSLKKRRYVMPVKMQTRAVSTQGRPPIAWGLTRKGSQYRGSPVKNNTTVSPLFKEHELMVSRTYATIEKGCRLFDGFELSFWERKLCLPPLQPQTYEELHEYETDSGFEITRPEKGESFFYEADNKTEPVQRLADPQQSDFSKKILFFQEWYRFLGEGNKPSFRMPMQDKAFRVLTSVPTPGRLASLQRLCRQLDPWKSKGQEEGKGLGIFWFCLHQDIDVDNPARFFFDPIWSRPSDQEPRSLLDLEQNAGHTEESASAA